MNPLKIPKMAVAIAITLVSPLDAQAQEAVPDQVLTPGRIELDETVISGNQELPKVLYILPWRDPQGLPAIDVQTEFTEAEVFRRLYPPAYRRELSYFETLEGLSDLEAQGSTHEDPIQKE